MLSIESARDTILSHLQPLPPEKVSLEEALGRYLAEDIVSSIDIPASNNSAMDGYALRCKDIKSAGTTLPVTSVLPAGSVLEKALESGQAVKIMTGAPIPKGADAVVKREDTIEIQGRVTIQKVPKKHEHIRFHGEDIKKGTSVLHTGDLIGPAQIGVLASLRHLVVSVYQRPVVAVIATGDEISEIDEPASAQKITSSNSYTLISLVKASGGIPLYLGIAKDLKHELINKLAEARRADLILTSGGVSMGDYDIVRALMSEDGNTLVFWKVDMKPGRPLAFGTLLGLPAIGLPGNPVSTMTSFYQFGRPAILKMMGARNLLLPRIRARLAVPVEHSGERPHYARGILQREGEDLCVRPTGPQGSGILTSMANGNCFIILPKGKTHVDKGEFVDCEVYHEIGML